MRFPPLAVAFALWFAACAPKAGIPPPQPIAPALLLDQAAALVRAGCLDCLLEAYRRYEALHGDPVVGPAAIEAAVTTAILVAFREADLGLVPSGSIERARDLVTRSSADQLLIQQLDVGEALSFQLSGLSSGAPPNPESIVRLRVARSQYGTWIAHLRERIPQDVASASLWLGLACAASGLDVPGREDRNQILVDLIDVPLLDFKRASGCPGPDRSRLNELIVREPRFVEARYFLGLSALSGQERVGATMGVPDLDAADSHFSAAFAWRQDWPSLTSEIANVAVTAEDFDRAFDFYGRTLALVPDHPGALLGRIRALTYLKRYSEAITAADQMLASGRIPGEALYWRAYNELQLERYDVAWEDIERADRLLINADVLKLAGIIAINRRDLGTARQRLELALSRRVTGCDAGFFLQAVLSEQRQWEEAARIASNTAVCLEDEIAVLEREIEAARAAAMSPERLQRRVARREDQIAAARRMRSTALFNAAAANFNLARTEAARTIAERLVDDPQFADRARELLARLPAR